MLLTADSRSGRNEAQGAITRILERIGTAAKWTWTVVAGMVTTALTGAAPMPVDPGFARDPDEPEDSDEDVSPEPRETP